MNKLSTFSLFYPKRKVPTYTISKEREELLENYQIFQAKKNNSYEKILFISQENEDKFPEVDPQIQKEKTEYISNLLAKYQKHLPWELMKNKLVLVKTQPIAKKNQLQFKEDPENNAENKEIKSKNPKENIEKNKKKEEEKIETLSEVKIVETSSMEELSSVHGSFEEEGGEVEGSEQGGGDYD